MRLFFRVISAFFIFLAMSTVSFSEVLRVTYTDNPEGDARLAYEIRLLDLALSKTGREYELIPKLRPASNERVVFLMQSEGAYDVAFLGARPEIEDRLIPVRFPTYRGLLGYRIGIIRQEDKERFAQIETLHDFRSLRMCQGTGWTDTRIPGTGGHDGRHRPVPEPVPDAECWPLRYFHSCGFLKHITRSTAIEKSFPTWSSMNTF